MPLDPTIPLQAQVPQAPNPLTTIGQFAQTQNAMNMNQLFNQQMQDRQTIGKAYQSATDPTTGQVDYNKLTGALAASGGGALVPGAIQAAQEQQNRALGITGQQLDQAQKKIGYINNVTGSLLQKPGGATPTDVTSALVDGMTSGILSKQDVMTQLQSMPSDPTQLQPWLQQHLLNAQEQGKKLDAIYGTPQLINQGGQQVPVAISPMNGVRQLGAPIANSVDPNTASQPTSWFDPTRNQMVTGTRAQFMAATQPASSPSTGMPGQLPAVPQKLLDQLATPAGNAASQATIAPPVANGGPLAAAPSLGMEAGANAAGTDSGHAMAATLTNAATSGQRIFALQKALDGLQNTNTGPGTDTRNQIVSFLQALPGGIGAALPGVDANSIKSYDEANKYLTQYASGSASAFGPSTDSKLATALTGNASTHISNLAAQDVVKSAIGLEKMGQAVAADAQAQGVQPAQFQSWQANWAKNNDPRAFVTEQMTPKQFSSLASSMSPGDLAKFRATFNHAIQSGYINPPSWMNKGAPNGGQQ